MICLENNNNYYDEDFASFVTGRFSTLKMISSYLEDVVSHKNTKYQKNSPQLIIGFESRVHTYDRKSQRYGVIDSQHKSQRPSKKDQYSYVLTITCFVHIHYLHMYTYELPRRFYNFVESHNNCEDIFLAGMVGEFLRKSGREQPCCIWVDGHGQHLEKIAKDFKGINHSNKQFWPQREQAMNMMVEEYGHMPLKCTKIFIET